MREVVGYYQIENNAVTGGQGIVGYDVLEKAEGSDEIGGTAFVHGPTGSAWEAQPRINA